MCLNLYKELRTDIQETMEWPVIGGRGPMGQTRTGMEVMLFNIDISKITFSCF